jgi:hypothetical protein
VSSHFFQETIRTQERVIQQLEVLLAQATAAQDTMSPKPGNDSELKSLQSQLRARDMRIVVCYHHRHSLVAPTTARVLLTVLGRCQLAVEDVQALESQLTLNAAAHAQEVSMLKMRLLMRGEVSTVTPAHS